MTGREGEGSWRQLSEEVIVGMLEWRLQHPKATFNQIETELDQRLARLRAQMLQDTVLASAATDWSESMPDQRPQCRNCSQGLLSAGKRKRRLQTQGRSEIELERQYGVCPDCGEKFFPPG